MTAPHPIPDVALEADIATLAQKGAGKTYLNKGLVERLLKWNRRLVVLDPLNVWWGLQVKADGSPGFPITVIGGPNADIPLDPSKGTQLGAFVARSAVQLVIDVSELKSGELVTFSIDFFAELYRLNRDPLWLVLEEADIFAPQNPQGRESFLLHEVDQIARRGRQRGFRLWTICQRPQELNKKTLSMASTLVLMRLRSPQDRAAAQKWIEGHATKAEGAEISGKLSSLKVGEGYVWAPDLDLLALAAFPRIETLDTSRTPQASDERPTSVRRAKPDLQALAALMAASGPGEPPNQGTGGKRDPIDSPALVLQLASAEARGYERGRSEGEAATRMHAAAAIKPLLDAGGAFVQSALETARAFAVAPS